MTVVGRHIIVDAFGCPADRLNDAELLHRLLQEAAEGIGAQVLNTYFHRFEPQGVTGAMVLSVSHVTIHTWPENQFAALDLFTCGDTDPRTVVDALVRGLGAVRSITSTLDRGLPEIESSSPPHLKPRAVRGDWGDLVELRELLNGQHRIHYHGLSPYQEVLVLEARDVRMYLDQQLQFSTLDERVYHEALVHPVMSMAQKRSRVLVLGGGDGLAMREVLKYADVQSADLVDIDPLVLRVSRENPAMTRLNEGSLLDERVRVHAEDAMRFVKRVTAPYDVIIVDFPDPADGVISCLYTQEFFMSVSQCLTHDGILVCQSYSPEDAPQVFWCIGRTFEEAGLHTLSFHVGVPTFGDWGFHIAGRSPLVWTNPPVPVAIRTLPENLEPWFSFSDEILNVRETVDANSAENLVLHQYYAEEAGPQ